METRMPFSAAPQVVPQKPEDVDKYKDEETIPMVFPRKVHLTTDHHTQVVFDVGVQSVPKSLADHAWLKNNGVKPYGEQKTATGTLPSARTSSEIRQQIEKLEAEYEVAVKREQLKAQAEQLLRGESVPAVVQPVGADGEKPLTNDTPVQSPEPEQATPVQNAPEQAKPVQHVNHQKGKR